MTGFGLNIITYFTMVVKQVIIKQRILFDIITNVDGGNQYGQV